MTLDRIFLSSRDLLKLTLETASFTLAVGPLLVFLGSDSLSKTIAATPVSLSLSVISLVIMPIVEKKMYEVLRGMRRGKVCFANS